jgi:hypothetical protein
VSERRKRKRKKLKAKRDCVRCKRAARVKQHSFCVCVCVLKMHFAIAYIERVHCATLKLCLMLTKAYFFVSITILQLLFSLRNAIGNNIDGSFRIGNFIKIHVMLRKFHLLFSHSNACDCV